MIFFKKVEFTSIGRNAPAIVVFRLSNWLNILVWYSIKNLEVFGKIKEEACGVMIVTFQEILDSIDGLSTEEQIILFQFVCQRQLQVELGDENDYLLSSPLNAAHLQRSIDELRQGKILEKELLDE
jgi:hypothetical protein